MESPIDQRRRKLQALQEQVRSGALKFSKENAALIVENTSNLVQSVRNAEWRAAAVICAALFHLILLQLKAERLLSRTTANQEGGLYGRSH